MPLEVTKARTLNPTEGSLTLIAGPPGLGKSWFCGTMAEYLDPSEVLLISTLPREVNSVQYQKHDLDTILVTDDQWEPDLGKKGLKAGGYDKMIETLRELRLDKKYKGVILDNGTEAGELAWHSVLGPKGVADPSELSGNTFALYSAMRGKMESLIRSLSILTGKTGLVEVPKLVVVPWHVQPKKEGAGDGESADEAAQGAEYEGDYLPMIRGGFRRRVAQLVDNFIYSSIENVRAPGEMTSEPRFVIQVVSDREKHVKLAGTAPKGDDLIKGRYLDVHDRDDAFREFMKILEAGQED